MQHGFFRFDEKTIADLIKNQKAREEAKKQEEALDYDGHKLTFTQAVDGNIVILSDPPLIVEVKEEVSSESEPTGSLDTYTPSGWKPQKV
jgi:hypothetical protein